jgi:hypothetical protein
MKIEYGTIIGIGSQGDFVVRPRDPKEQAVILDNSADKKLKISDEVEYSIDRYRRKVNFAKYYKLVSEADNEEPLESLEESVKKLSKEDISGISALVLYDPLETGLLYHLICIARRHEKVHEAIGRVPGYQDGKGDGCTFCFPCRTHSDRRYGKGYIVSSKLQPGKRDRILYLGIEGLVSDGMIKESVFRKCVRRAPLPPKNNS